MRNENDSLRRFQAIAADPDESSQPLIFDESLDRWMGTRRGYVRSSNWMFDFAPAVPGATGHMGSYEDRSVIDKYILSAFSDVLLEDDANARMYAQVLSMIPPELHLGEEAVIVDAGCGLGRTTYDLADRFPHALTVGFDLSLGMLATARDLLAGRELSASNRSLGFGAYRFRRDPVNADVFLARADVTRLPLGDGSVDMLVNVYLIDRLAADQGKFFAEARRVLKDGGHLITLDPLNFREEGSWTIETAAENIPLSELRRRAIEKTAMELRKCFEEVEATPGPPFRTMTDAAGNYSNWNTVCFRTVKTSAELN